ncbi:MAG: division plane positioning ATPase MipZ, partial [Alphaproteobacteria bacterium]|nr:division plane positioning ATPase MipZ [Alphaproteobacteria bacterium]
MNINKSAHIIVLGNEKGGSGKSTTAIHLTVGLMQLGVTVATIDLDSRQGTLTRYLENRKRFAELEGVDLACPTHKIVLPSDERDKSKAETEDEERLTACIAELSQDHQVVVIDSPGSASNLSTLGHSYANTLITPLNDSFIDLDVIARIEHDSLKIEKPSHYAAMVFQEKMKRAQRD